MDRARQTWSDPLGPVLVLAFLVAQTWANFGSSLCLCFLHHAKKKCHQFLPWELNSNLGFPAGSRMVKNLPAVQKTQVQSLGRKDPLEKEMETHSSILAGEFHG